MYYKQIQLAIKTHGNIIETCCNWSTDINTCRGATAAKTYQTLIYSMYNATLHDTVKLLNCETTDIKTRCDGPMDRPMDWPTLVELLSQLKVYSTGKSDILIDFL